MTNLGCDNITKLPCYDIFCGTKKIRNKKNFVKWKFHCITYNKM